MRIAVLLLVSAILVMACSDDGRPRDAIETELTTSIVMGAFDPDVGRVGYTIVYVNIDGETYEMNAAPGAEFIGFDELNSFELSGRRALVAGDLVDGIYMATYLEVLPNPGVVMTPELERKIAELEELEVSLADLQQRYGELVFGSTGDGASSTATAASQEATEAAIRELEDQMLALMDKISLLDQELAEAGL